MKKIVFLTGTKFPTICITNPDEASLLRESSKMKNLTYLLWLCKEHETLHFNLTSKYCLSAKRGKLFGSPSMCVLVS